MNALAGLMNPAAIGADVQNAFEVGREKMKQQQTESALSAYAANPEDPMAFQAVAKYAPKFAIQIGADRRQQEAAAALAAKRVAVASGQAPASDLAGVDWDGYRQMTKDQAEIAKQNVDTIGQMALLADTPQEWDATIDKLGPEFAQYKGRFDLRETVIARAGQVKEFLAQNEPKYMAAPEGAGLINVKDPNAVKAWNAGVSTSEPTTKVINGNTYYNVGGKWFDELPQGGSVGNGAGGF